MLSCFITFKHPFTVTFVNSSWPFYGLPLKANNGTGVINFDIHVIWITDWQYNSKGFELNTLDSYS